LNIYTKSDWPISQGLYHPQREHSSCGLAFVANIKGIKSHTIVQDGLTALNNLSHRGATSADPRTGDGAGIMIQMPDEFLRERLLERGLLLPQAGEYAAGNLFLPQDQSERETIKSLIAAQVSASGLTLIGWCKVVTDNSTLGEESKKYEPVIEQLFVGMGSLSPAQFPLALYRLRRRIEKELLSRHDLVYRNDFYICSLSPDTLTYKGMFLADQLGTYYTELNDPRLTSAAAMVHQRFSTNTFPSWKLAHPFRFIAHNGEFNTIQGNINSMRSREYLLQHAALDDAGITDICPVIPDGLSDSASFDAAVDLLSHSGRSLPHILAMMVPEAWGSRKHMNEHKRDFYRYHANLMEPWDGPAAIAAFNGHQLCAILDRNGLRPARFTLTTDERIIFGSEVGILPIDEEKIKYTSRLWPGKMILVDLKAGLFMEDEETKATFINSKPYSEWLARGLIAIPDLPDPIRPPKSLQHNIDTYYRAFGYTEEELTEILSPMILDGAEAVGSMGNDAPLAILSQEPKLLFDYFRQKFAQVTNPAIDSIREELVMGSHGYFGSQWNMFDEGPEYCHQLFVHSPILTNYELEQIAQAKTKYVRGTTLSLTMENSTGTSADLQKALLSLCKKAEERVHSGYNALILSDRSISPTRMVIPSLLAVAAVHHHLIKAKKRGNIGIIVETGEARSCHHVAVLFSYGAVAVNPYLAFEAIRDMRARDLLQTAVTYREDDEDPCAAYDRNYIKALVKGVLKIMSKMGISTLRSYRGAQTFEALGLSEELLDSYFCGTLSQLSGIGLKEIHAEMLARHRFAFAASGPSGFHIAHGGEYKWRPDGELHAYNPETIVLMQRAVREGSYPLFKKYSALVNDCSKTQITLRSLLDFDKKRAPLPLDAVEPEEQIITRFVTGAMSLGAISKEAHETLAIAMNRLKAKSNSGEGGEDDARYEPDISGDNPRSAIKQIASGRFGVTTHYLVNADELQIKVAQGAKPGEGGQLPGYKVTDYIARLRHSIPGVTLISPPPHHDIYSIEDLEQLIFDLKNVNPSAEVSVKLVAEAGVGTVAAGVAKARADRVVISGHDGGTGASPLSSIKHAGIPWELGLAETQQTLLLNSLRDRVRLQVDGQLKTGRDVVIAALLGAEEFGFATAALVAEGCLMMRKCHSDTCPVGIATQDPELRKNFAGKAETVMNFMRFIAAETREIMAELGFRSMSEMIGQTGYLTVKDKMKPSKSQTLKLERLLHVPQLAPEKARFCHTPQRHPIVRTLDHQLIALAAESLKTGQTLEADFPIRNSDRSTGAMLSGHMVQQHGKEGVPPGLLRFNFNGTSGQSFGAFLASGISFTLTGRANDYVGKGLSGGLIVVKPSLRVRYAPEHNWIGGNTLLYGATSGNAFFAGRVGERFAVRNSGCYAVTEGVGDHGCEYMTGGIVVVLGPTGRNFAAGMSGGAAYILDEERLFSRRCNTGMVDIEQVTEADHEILRVLVGTHHRLTGSARAGQVLNQWDQLASLFVKVMPREYRRVASRIDHLSRIHTYLSGENHTWKS
jgi:glutamate synthase domain-containing protein 2/glutamate synthase domain-containing protein 1/glutamate synthase domain-containing protein 3